jgi:hypothetical protein
MSEKHNLSELLFSLFSLKAILPGSITQQHRSCGYHNCRCMRKENPEKHPYFQFTYDIEGQKSTVYLKNAEIDTAREMSDSYKELRLMVNQISLAVVDLVRENGVIKGRDMLLAEIAKQRGKAAGMSAKTLPSAKAKIVIDNWKSKALERQAELKKQRIKIRDLTDSRDNWRKVALKERKTRQALEKQLAEEIARSKAVSVESGHSIKKN